MKTLTQVSVKMQEDFELFEQHAQLATALERMFSNAKERLQEAVDSPAWSPEIRRAVLATLHEISDSIVRQDLGDCIVVGDSHV